MRIAYRVMEGRASDLRFVAEGYVLAETEMEAPGGDELPPIEALHAPEFLIALAWLELRAERDARLAETDWAMARHRDQVELAVATALTATQYKTLPQYRQDLRDLPANTADPATPMWPALSDTIKGKLGMG